MPINKITNADAIVLKKADVSKKAQLSDTINSVNNLEVETVAAAEALKSNNVPLLKNYTFLKNINIPALNLNANLYQLPNGQKCVIAKKDGPCVLKTYFKVGSMNEPDNIRGISHFIEHNLFNGSKNLKATEFVSKVNGMGGKYNASTGMISTDYFIQSPLHTPDDLEKFIKMHADMLSKPTFSDEMLEKEKGPVISEIQMLADNPANLATNIAIKNLFNINTQSSDLIGGSVKNIENITRNDVINYYKANYNPKTALTVVIGDIDEKKTLELLSQNFKDFKADNLNQERYNEKLLPVTNPIRQDVRSENTQSTIVNLAFSGPKNSQNKTAISMMLYALAGYKNAKLSKEMRKLNLDIVAGIEPISNVADNPTVIMLQTSVGQNNPEEILKLIYKNIHEMSYTPISDEDLKIIKNKILAQLKYSAESNMALASILGSNYINENNFDSVVNYEKNVNSITKEDIMNAAREFLNLNRASVSVVHPKIQKSVSFAGQKIDYKTKTYRTANNAQITTLNDKNAKTYSLSIILKNNLIPSKSPISLILGNMLAKGTSLMPENEFYNIEDNNNISRSISTDYNQIVADYSFPKESLDIVLNNYKMNMFSPALSKENFEKAKEEIKNLYLANPKSASHRANEVLYEDTPRAYTLRRIYEELDTVTYEDIINYYSDFIKNAQCKVIASGDFSNNNALNTINCGIWELNKMFDTQQTEQVLKPKKLVKNVIIGEAQERNQADIVQKFRIKETGNIKDKAAIYLLNEILGGNSNSRLFNDLRETQKLAYRVNSSYISKENDGILTLRIFTTTDDESNPEQFKNLQYSLNGFNSHINKLIKEPVSEAELAAAKLQIKSNLLFNLESTTGKNSMLFTSMDSFYKENYLKELLNAIEQTTPADIQKIANHYLSQPSVVSIIASENTLKNNEKFLNSLGEYKKY